MKSLKAEVDRSLKLTNYSLLPISIIHFRHKHDMYNVNTYVRGRMEDQMARIIRSPGGWMEVKWIRKQ